MDVSPEGQKRGWRLAIVEQPESEFYKDEGGKNHALEVTLELQNVGHAPLPDIPADQPLLPLRASLYYESEERVEEDQQDILRILAPRGDAFAIDFDSLRVHIRYRIEKVSRRKDGQRFKLFVEPDRDRCHEVFTRVRGVFTNPVTVLSKRKSGAARPEVASKRARPAEVELHHVAKFVQRIERQLTELQQVASAVVNTASAQAQRLEALERLLTQSDGGVAAALAARPTALAAPPAATGTVTLPRATALVPPAAAHAPAPGWFPSSSASASTGPSLSGGMGLARAAVPGPGRGVPPAGGIGAGSGSAEGAPDPVLAGADMQASYSPTLAAKNGAAEVLAGLASGQWQLPRPQHVGRLRSRDMQFNFGPPSPVTSQ